MQLGQPPLELAPELVSGFKAEVEAKAVNSEVACMQWDAADFVARAAVDHEPAHSERGDPEQAEDKSWEEAADPAAEHGGGNSRERAEREAWEMAYKSLPTPLEYDVVRPEGITVHDSPSAGGLVLGCLACGATVVGTPGKGWLRLKLAIGASHPDKELADGWTFIGGRLEARCLRAVPLQNFAEAVAVTWPGLPFPCVTYSVEWRAAGRATSHSTREAAGCDGDRAAGVGRGGGFCSGYHVVSGPQATISGAPADTPLQMRVIARVFAADGVGKCTRIFGPWSEVRTGPPLQEALEADPESCVDPFGVSRGGCAESNCYGFVWDRAALSRDQAGTTNADQRFDTRCCRCGHAFDSHADVRGDIPELKSSAPSTYVVVEAHAAVRAWRDEGSECLGSLKKGDMVRGCREGPWLRLDANSARAAVKRSARPEGPPLAAWVLVDGSRLGLGQLLVLHEKPGPRALPPPLPPPRREAALELQRRF